MNKKFGTALNCIDGRTQIPVIMWMNKNLGLDYIDLITEPGMDKVLSKGNKFEIDKVKKNTIVSIDAHDSKIIAVVGHYDCAANPVSPYKHVGEIKESIRTVISWSLGVKVIGLWVDDFWKVHQV